MMSLNNSQSIVYEFLLKKKVEFEIANRKDLVDYVNSALSQLPFEYYKGKCAPIPLSIFEIWPALSHEERSTFASALVHTKFTPYKDVIKDIMQSEEKCEEGIDVVKVEEMEFDEVQLTHQSMAKVYRPTTYNHDLYFAEHEVRDEEFELIRNPTLMFKLRRVITWLKNLRQKYLYRVEYGNFIEMTNMADKFEMEATKVDTAGKDESTSKAGNVVLGDTQVPSVDKAAENVVDYTVMSTNEPIHNYPGMTDRFVYHDTYTWTTNNVRGTKLVTLRLPYDWITKVDLCRAPSFTPFNVHRYCKFDMEVRLQINSNVFQVGQLIMAWYYLKTSTKELSSGPSVYTMVQLPHAKVSATVGNEAILYIPYQYFKPLIHTKKRDTYPVPLDLGTLYVSVLSKLSVPSGGNTSCSFSIYVRLRNCSFTGTLDGSIDKLVNTASHEMEGIVSELGSEVGMMLYKGVKDLLIGDKNCDNPPNLTPPKFFVPQTSHTWSIGNGEQHPVNMLRLSHVKATGRKGIADNDLQLSLPCSIFGLLLPFEWNSAKADTNKAGYRLWSTNVHPQCDKDQLYIEVSASSGLLQVYSVPPVSVVSSLYEVWRGSLEYKFDFIAGPYHTGRILIAYIPGVTASTNVTLDQARNSAHIVHDMASSLSCTFVVPYIADKVWWPRKYGGAQRAVDYISPSAIFMFVLNPLVANPNVSTSIEILPYVRAGQDFEVAIPAQPAIGLWYERATIFTASNMIPLPGYYPYYVGTQGDYDLDTGKAYILRYGPVWQHYTQFAPVVFPKAEIGKAIIFQQDDSAKLSTGAFYLKGSTVQHWAKYLVYFDIDGYVYGLVFSESERSLALRVGYSWQTKRSQAEINDLIKNRVDLDESKSTYSRVGFKQEWKLIQAEVPATQGAEYVFVEHEMERVKSENVMEPGIPLASTNSGKVTYGEKFNDFKDLLRRYQLYAEIDVNLDAKVTHNGALMMFPLSPSGLTLDYNSKSRVWDARREGHMPIIASGYRFFRGGMRLRIVFPPGIDANVWVQHKPNTLNDYGNKVLLGANIKAEDAVRNHSFAYHIQNLRINNVIELSVPFYQPGCYGILRPLAMRSDLESQLFSTLGDIIIGVENLRSSIGSVSVSIYTAIEDDMSFNTFLGFPPVVFCDEVLSTTALSASHEMDSVRNWFWAPVTKSIDQSINKVADEAKDFVEAKIDTVQDISHKVVEHTKSSLKESILPSISVNVVSQFLHCLANPSAKTLAISLVSILFGTLYISMDIIMKAYTAMETFLLDNWRKLTGEEEGFEGDDVATFEMPKESSGSLAVYAILTTVVAFITGKTLPNSVTGGSFNFMRNVTVAAGLTFNIIRILENCQTAFKEMLVRVSETFSPDARLLNSCIAEVPVLEDWMREAVALTDSRQRSAYAHNNVMVTRVYNTTYLGGLILAKGLDTRHGAGRFVFHLYEKLVRLRDDLVLMGAHPDVRFEPFSLYFTGKPGIGKSFISSYMSVALLEAVNYKGVGPCKYDLQQDPKYWNCIQSEPVLYKDDAYVLRGEAAKQEIMSVMQICSSAVLNPPMARVEQKEKRINPLIYMCNSNSAFPCLSADMNVPGAIFRRRVLVHYDYSNSFKDKYLKEGMVKNSPKMYTYFATLIRLAGTKSGIVSEEDVKDGAHLVGYIQEDPEDENELARAGEEAYIPFDNVVAKLKIMFVEYYEKELKSFRNRMELIYKFDPNFKKGSQGVTVPVMEDTGIDLGQLMREQKKRALELALEAELNHPYYPYIKKIRETLDSKFGSAFKTFSSYFGDSVPKSFVPDVSFEMGVQEIKDIVKCKESNFVCAVPIPPDEQVVMFKSWDLPVEVITAALVEEDGTCILDDMSWNEIVSFAFKQDTINDTELIYTPNYTVFQAEPFEMEYDMLSFAKDMNKYMPNEIADYLNWTSNNKSHVERVKDFLKAAIRYNNGRMLIAYHRHTNFDEYISKFLVNLEQAYAKAGKEFDNSTKSKYYHIYAGVRGAQTCSHMAAYAKMLNEDFAKIRYDAINKKWIFRDSYGFQRAVPADCKCESSVVNNIIFQRFLGWIYNTQNKVAIELGQKFAYDIVDRTVRYRYIKSLKWCSATREKLKDFWADCVLPQFRELVVHIVKYLPHMLSAITLIGTVAGVAWMGKKILSKSDNNISSWVPEASSNYYKFDTPKAMKQNVSQANPGKFEQSPQQRITIQKRIENNFVFINAIWLEDGVRRERSCRCLMLFERVMLFQRHFYEEYRAILDKNPTFYFILNQSGKQASIILTFEQLFNNIKWNKINSGSNSSNFGISYLPRHVTQFKNILHLFATKSMHANISTVCDVYSLTEPSQYDMPIKRAKQFYISDHQSNSSDIIMGEAYTYMYRGKGLCGSVLVSSGLNGGNGAIIGMHVAGNSSNGLGVAEPIYRETFEELYATLHSHTKEIVEMPLLDLEDAEVQLDSNLLLYGCVPKQFAHSESGKTKIVPSVIAGVLYPVTTEVNPLKPNDPRQPPGSHPLRDGCNKHGSGNVKPFDTNLLRLASEGLCNELIQQIQPIRASIMPLTLQQAICGDTSVKYFSPLNWKSSEGFPLSSLRPVTAHDKRWLFDLKENECGYRLDGMQKCLKQQLAIRDKCFKEKKKPNTIYVDCLKDYRLKPEKCTIPGKTRIFSVAPIALTIDCRRYLGDFLASFKNCRIKNMCGIGINPDSMEWTQLVHYLHEVGNNIVTLDYSNYGPTLMSQLVVEAIDIIVAWHEYHGASEEHIARVKWILENDLLNPMHLCGNVVYQTLNGISSGSPLTGELNSIPNMLYIIMAWLKITKRNAPNNCNFIDFIENVRLVVYGDDLILSVSDKFKGIFNGISISNTLNEHGIVLTSASKDSEMIEYSCITKNTFLKRSFQKHPTRSGVWLAPIDEASVKESINWIHTCADPKQACAQNCEISLFLAYSLGPEFYEEHRKKITRVCNDAGIIIRSKPWIELDNNIFEEGQVLIDFVGNPIPWVWNNSFYNGSG